jgi:predicted enzyme related to lactoylglutathione lyase
MNVRFSGINIHAKDPVKSFEFYKGLGFPVTEEAEPDSVYYGASFDLGGSTLWIWRDGGGETAGNIKRVTDESKTPTDPETSVKSKVLIEIVLSCPDMDITYTHLIAKGYTLTAPELMFYGGREMKLSDPDGNRILFLD